MRIRPAGRARWIVPVAAAAVALLVVGVVLALRVGSRGSSEPSTAPRVTTASPSPTAAPPTAASPTAPGSATPGTTASTTGTPARPPTTAPAPPPAPPPTAFPASLRGRDVTVLPTSRRVVALTFDAGANAAGLASILRTLSAAHVRATFFLTGRWAAADPASVVAIRAAGHRIGNHSATHPNFPKLSDAQIRSEVLGAQSTLLGAGADPRPFFRFPFGDRDPRTIAAVNDLGYVAVRWTVDTLGWEGTSGGMSAQGVADRALRALQPGEIVLMHVGSNPDDGTTLDADALPGVIGQMRAAGYDFVTLDALLG